MATDKLRFCECLTLDERIDLNDAILFAQSNIINSDAMLEKEKLNNKIEADIYDRLKKDNDRMQKKFRNLQKKIENTPRCLDIGKEGL